MNAMWYVGKFDDATGSSSPRSACRRELHAGNVVVVRTGVLEVRDKA